MGRVFVAVSVAAPVIVGGVALLLAVRALTGTWGSGAVTAGGAVLLLLSAVGCSRRGPSVILRIAPPGSWRWARRRLGLALRERNAAALRGANRRWPSVREWRLTVWQAGGRVAGERQGSLLHHPNRSRRDTRRCVQRGDGLPVDRHPRSCRWGRRRGVGDLQAHPSVAPSATSVGCASVRECPLSYESPATARRVRIKTL
jgi:hypothetical protein